jgi:hypothetical protein
MKEETRIKATTEEAQQWEDEYKTPNGLSSIFHGQQLMY